ncbi:MAG TPA: hypothetical protein HPP87_06815 [Planctomycetes bacterium]|nr:hypothetical protein [Planctomycetota bacterium]
MKIRAQGHKSIRAQGHKSNGTGRTYTLMFLCTFALFVSCAGCEKETKTKADESGFKVDKTFERGPLAVHVRLDKDKITIADTCLLQFEAAIDPKYEVQMPQVGTELQNFGILDWDNLGDRLDEENNVVSTYQYRLEPFLSGKYQLPAFTFRFSDANSLTEKKYTLTTEPIDIEVASLLGEDRENLAIADIEDVVDMPRSASLWPLWIFAGCIVIAAPLTGWLYLRRRRISELVRIFKPAHEIAYVRLKALVKEDLVAAGKIREFYERISDILRHYIEHRFDLRAPERTTEEFLAELALSDVLAGTDKKMLEEFLTHCDLVKFAKHQPTHDQVQRTFDIVKEFIEKTKSDESKIDVTDSQEHKCIRA